MPSEIIFTFIVCVSTWRHLRIHTEIIDLYKWSLFQHGCMQRFQEVLPETGTTVNPDLCDPCFSRGAFNFLKNSYPKQVQRLMKIYTIKLFFYQTLSVGSQGDTGKKLSSSLATGKFISMGIRNVFFFYFERSNFVLTWVCFICILFVCF